MQVFPESAQRLDPHVLRVNTHELELNGWDLSMTKAWLGALGAAAFCVGTPAVADPIGFLEINQVTWTQDAAQTGGTLTSIGSGQFQIFGSDPVFPVIVNLTGFSNSAPSDQTYDTTLSIRNLKYNFEITYDGEQELQYYGSILRRGDNVLSGYYANSYAEGSGGSFESKILEFTGYGYRNFFVLALLDPGRMLGILPGKSAPSFSIDEPSRFAFFASVPEPQSWAMMIAGFGFAGIALRRRKWSGVPHGVG